MMKKIFFLTALCLIIIAAVVFALPHYQKPMALPGDKLKVAATIFPLADLVKNVGKERIIVSNMLPQGASPHTYEAMPSDILNLQGTKIIFAIGNGFDNWATNIAENAGNVLIVAVDKDIKKNIFIDEDESPEPQVDPHYWLSIDNAKIIVLNIAGELSKIDPAGANEYKKNAALYQAELTELKKELINILTPLPAKNLIVFHGSWNYFAKEYGLNIAGVFEPSPGKEPSPRYLKDLNDTAKKYNIKSVFTEPQLFSAAIEPFVKDLGLEIFMLNPEGGISGQDSYIELMRYNAQTIQNALIDTIL